MIRLFTALYATEPLHRHWCRTGAVWAKARAVVTYDRILTGNERRILVKGEPLNLGYGVDK